MEWSLLVLVVILLSSALAKPQLWVFPDQLEKFTKKPSKVTFRPTPPSGPVWQEGGQIQGRTTPTTPSPDVIFVIPGCECSSPPQYNPVCGTDGLSYVNAQFLNCARRCGTDVKVARMGACRGRFSADNYLKPPTS